MYINKISFFGLVFCTLELRHQLKDIVGILVIYYIQHRCTEAFYCFIVLNQNIFNNL